jgi:integrase/recombinase XerD
LKIKTAVRIYVAHKRSMGWEFSGIEKYLSAFARHIGDVHLSNIKATNVAAFLQGPRTSAEMWHQGWARIRRFFDYWKFRHQMYRVPMPLLIPRPIRTFVPYIYSRAEISRLVSDSALSATNERIPLIDPLTFRTLLLFLYGTGVFVSEAISLRECDVDFGKSVITVQRNKHCRRRTIPIGADVHKLLKNYMSSRVRKKFNGGNFFLTRKGTPVMTTTLVANFQRLRRRANVVRLDGAVYQPRMHDLRSTFTVHRIADWYEKGTNAQQMLPALGAYLGQTGFVSIIRHLSLTPQHFRKQFQPNSRKLGAKLLHKKQSTSTSRMQSFAFSSLFRIF